MLVEAIVSPVHDTWGHASRHPPIALGHTIVPQNHQRNRDAHCARFVEDSCLGNHTHLSRTTLGYRQRCGCDKVGHREGVFHQLIDARRGRTLKCWTPLFVPGQS